MSKKNEVRVVSTDTLVTNASVEIASTDGEWHDIRHTVQNIVATLNIGEISRVHLDLIAADVEVEGRFDDDTIAAFAAILRARGWECTAPVPAPST